MRFNPISTAQYIVNDYKEYVKETFYINDESLQQKFEQELDTQTIAKGPYLECIDAFETKNSIKELVENGLLSKEFEKLFKNNTSAFQRPLYLHQQIAIEKSQQDKNLVITTGTGSGKTECFIYPILQELMNQMEQGENIRPGIHALLIYPMNALANDQMKRLRELLENYPSITFGAYTGETEQFQNNAAKKYLEMFGKKPISNEYVSREVMIENPPHILITNYAMLEYLLIRPKENSFFAGPYSDSWKYIVLDEAHTYRGATGMEVSMLMRRLVHYLPNNEKIRFILTSATLGDPQADKEICTFAKLLCDGRPFDGESIVRASRITPVCPKDCYPIPSERYPIALLFADINNKENSYLNDRERNEEIARITGVQKYPTILPLAEFLFEIFNHDSFLYRLRTCLSGTVKTVEEVQNQLNIQEEELVAFITLSSIAQKDKTKLLDARYHEFLRTLEGAYVTFKPKKTLSVRPKSEMDFKELGIYKCFKISICQYCGTIYLEGDKIASKLNQEKEYSGHYFMVLKDDSFINASTDDELDISNKAENIYKLCCKCGTLERNSALGTPSCKHPESDKILVYEIKPKPDQDELHTCEFCHTTNTRGSVLRGFYLGQDASTAVIGASLYESIPIKEFKLKQKETSRFNRKQIIVSTKETKQMLVFSDSRQEAAYFASYFGFTYNNILRRRLLLQVAQTLAKNHYQDVPIPLLNYVESIAQELNRKKISPPEQCKKEAWKTVMYELRSGDRNGLKNLGLLSFEYDALFDQGDNYYSCTEIHTLEELLMESFMTAGAVYTPINDEFLKEDLKYFMYSGKLATISCYSPIDGIIEAEHQVSNWVSKNTNSRMDYLKRNGKIGNIEDIKNLLLDIFQAKENDEKSLFRLGNGYQLKPEMISVHVTDIHPISWYRCNTCGRLTTHSIKNTCPHFRCQGKLEPYKQESTGGYHQDKISEKTLFPMRIKEHTAQLSHETARNYQQGFIEGDIQVLSSSTTFEMGVDVGDLETVFMKNMPPSPANYIQRAGRAGRRSDSAAFALTFCRLASHDLTFFKEPEKMIQGKITPPSFKIDNEKIVKRHIYAALLGGFWRQNIDIKTVGEIFEESKFLQLQLFTSNLAPDMKAYIRSFIPTTISQKEIESFIFNYGGTEGLLNSVRNSYLCDLNDLDNLKKEFLETEKYSLIPRVDKISSTITKTEIIPFFSRNNLIPKYGFPVDTIELRTNLSNLSALRDSDSNISLQRDMIQGITEYAPDSQIIADGKIYTSKFVRKPYSKQKDWMQYSFGFCSNPQCSSLNITRYVGDDQRHSIPCKNCGIPCNLKDVYIEPQDGFIVSTDPPVEATTKRPKKASRTEISYIGDGFERNSLHENSYQLGKRIFSIKSANNDKLAVINKSDYYVCLQCGYTERSKSTNGWQKIITKSHKTFFGKNCSNKILERRTFGHTFLTDVALITVDTYFEKIQALSIMYALLEGATKFFNLERNDIDGCVSYRNSGLQTSFILYDTVPGGAGNVKNIGEASQEAFIGMLKESNSVVEDCTCGDNGDGNAACYSCLLNYKNQFYHDKLKRKYAMNFFKELSMI
jgi:hypothetical protein